MLNINYFNPTREASLTFREPKYYGQFWLASFFQCWRGFVLLGFLVADSVGVVLKLAKNTHTSHQVHHICSHHT